MDVTRGQLLPVGKLPFKKRVMSLALGMASVGMFGQLHAAPYLEAGRAGQPDSWRSPEFNPKDYRAILLDKVVVWTKEALADRSGIAPDQLQALADYFE